MGYPRYLDMITLGQIPGVYIETSWGLTGIAELNGLTYTSKLLRLIGIDNVLYGSDWVGPQVGMEMVRQLGLIEKLDLTREEKDKILGGNISKILGL
jgi:predicted TIM-barrel fold metal-dependent hydrolase